LLNWCGVGEGTNTPDEEGKGRPGAKENKARLEREGGGVRLSRNKRVIWMANRPPRQTWVLLFTASRLHAISTDCVPGGPGHAQCIKHTLARSCQCDADQSQGTSEIHLESTSYVLHAIKPDCSPNIIHPPTRTIAILLGNPPGYLGTIDNSSHSD
jgi:hypothetical protein